MYFTPSTSRECGKPIDFTAEPNRIYRTFYGWPCCEKGKLRRRSIDPACLLIPYQAFNLAKRSPNYEELARRFHSFYFLATPHRGANNAQMLNNILRASPLHNTRQFVADLDPNSGSLEDINEDFYHYCQGARVCLFSFYETAATNVGPGINILIVEKSSARLGMV